jgi:hypothetical protein
MSANQAERAGQSIHAGRQNVDMSDAALIEDALTAALDAHAAGKLAAPFGVDEVALRTAIRRATRADIARSLRAGSGDLGDAAFEGR